MSITVNARLAVGFLVYPTDLYTEVRSEKPLCGEGHAQTDATQAFCPKDGTRFTFQRSEVPTPILLEIAQLDRWRRLEQVKCWSDKVRDELDCGHLLNCAPVRGSCSEVRIVFGMVLETIQEDASTTDATGHSLAHIEQFIINITALRDKLGFPSDRQVKVFMSLYYS